MAPLPKKKHSKSRTKRARAHFGLKAPQLSKCPSCPTLIRPHRACPKCGIYKGEYYVDTATFEAKKVNLATK
jgi:large subunit ribosomal protein L32